MIHALRRRSALILLVTVVLSGGVAQWLAERATFDQTAGAPASGSALFDQSASAAEPDKDAGVRIEYRGQVGDLYYYVVENEFVDDVAIITQQFRLPSSTTFKDRRTLVQSVLPRPAPESQPVRKNLPPAPPPADNPHLLSLEWVCDRYFASEKVSDMKEVSFDSLRHTHPMRELSGLARIPQSRATFTFDGRTGKASAIAVKPGPVSHPTDNRQSKTAEHALVTPENMQELLYAMGEQFLPNEPRKVGDTWLIKQVKPQSPFGTITTDTTCTLKSIQRSGDADIALIDLVGVIFFDPSPVKPPPGPPHIARGTTQPVTSAPRYPPAPTPPLHKATTRPAVPIQTPPKSGTPPTPPAPVAPNPGPVNPSLDHIPLPQVLSAPPAAPTLSDHAPPASHPTTAPTSMPMDIPPSTPVTQPAPRGNEDPFKMEKALFTGTIRFDVTHGRLVELTMRRTGAFVKVMRSDKEEMKIKQGSAHTLRIKGSVNPPPRPVIPDGPKPPVETPPPNARTVPPVTTKPVVPPTTLPAATRAATTQRTATTRPAPPTIRSATTRPATPPAGK